MPSTSAKLVRNLNPLKPQVVSIGLNPQQITIINRLYSTGLYGNTPRAVVQRVFCDGLAAHLPANPAP